MNPVGQTSPQCKVFVSYSRRDSEVVSGLVRDLGANGLTCWLDQSEIQTGAAWESRIEDAIRNCSTFVVVVTRASSQSDMVRGEISFALQMGKPVVPLLFESCDLPLRLINLNHIDFTSTDYRGSLQSLVGVLNGTVDIASYSRPIEQEVPSGFLAKIAEVCT